MIAQKLIDARALVARIEAIGETRCEATPTSLESKKKEVCKLEKPIERINNVQNEDIERIFIPLIAAVMEVGLLLKSLIVDLGFFGSVL